MSIHDPFPSKHYGIPLFSRIIGQRSMCNTVTALLTPCLNLINRFPTTRDKSNQDSPGSQVDRHLPRHFLLGTLASSVASFLNRKAY
ncbi:uncharacterized protein BDV14DRAFT_178475 [Aspergillus stella-maris]|uniref:uncharacterized protein n=1 Tax=Aspergillus stella-maris TaxID=1810926 RepID=UPI003CCCE3AB